MNSFIWLKCKYIWTPVHLKYFLTDFLATLEHIIADVDKYNKNCREPRKTEQNNKAETKKQKIICNMYSTVYVTKCVWLQLQWFQWPVTSHWVFFFFLVLHSYSKYFVVGFFHYLTFFKEKKTKCLYIYSVRTVANNFNSTESNLNRIFCWLFKKICVLYQ